MVQEWTSLLQLWSAIIVCGVLLCSYTVEATTTQQVVADQNFNSSQTFMVGSTDTVFKIANIAINGGTDDHLFVDFPSDGVVQQGLVIEITGCSVSGNIYVGYSNLGTSKEIVLNSGLIRVVENEARDLYVFSADGKMARGALTVSLFNDSAVVISDNVVRDMALVHGWNDDGSALGAVVSVTISQNSSLSITGNRCSRMLESFVAYKSDLTLNMDTKSSLQISRNFALGNQKYMRSFMGEGGSTVSFLISGESSVVVEENTVSGRFRFCFVQQYSNGNFALEGGSILDIHQNDVAQYLSTFASCCGSQLGVTLNSLSKTTISENKVPNDDFIVGLSYGKEWTWQDNKESGDLNWVIQDKSLLDIHSNSAMRLFLADTEIHGGQELTVSSEAQVHLRGNTVTSELILFRTWITNGVATVKATIQQQSLVNVSSNSAPSLVWGQDPRVTAIVESTSTLIVSQNVIAPYSSPFSTTTPPVPQYPGLHIGGISNSSSWLVQTGSEVSIDSNQVSNGNGMEVFTSKEGSSGGNVQIIQSSISIQRNAISLLADGSTQDGGLKLFSSSGQDNSLTLSLTAVTVTLAQNDILSLASQSSTVSTSVSEQNDTPSMWVFSARNQSFLSVSSTFANISLIENNLAAPSSSIRWGSSSSGGSLSMTQTGLGLVFEGNNLHGGAGNLSIIETDKVTASPLSVTLIGSGRLTFANNTLLPVVSSWGSATGGKILFAFTQNSNNHDLVVFQGGKMELLVCPVETLATIRTSSTSTYFFSENFLLVPCATTASPPATTNVSDQLSTTATRAIDPTTLLYPTSPTTTTSFSSATGTMSTTTTVALSTRETNTMSSHESQSFSSGDNGTAARVDDLTQNAVGSGTGASTPGTAVIVTVVVVIVLVALIIGIGVFLVYRQNQRKRRSVNERSAAGEEERSSDEVVAEIRFSNLNGGVLPFHGEPAEEMFASRNDGKSGRQTPHTNQIAPPLAPDALLKMGQTDSERMTSESRANKINSPAAAAATKKEISSLEELVSPQEKMTKFRRGKLIGSGGFGKVYLGFDLNTGKTIAAKQVTLNSDTKERQLHDLRLLSAEVENMQRLAHPNIVKYLGGEQGSGEDGVREFYILMEWMPAGSVLSTIRNFGRLPPKIAARYTRHALQGLCYLHEQGFVHRDLKAANMLLDKDGVLKLADLGSAQRTESVNSLRGTAFWLAPEVLRSGSGRSKLKSDSTSNVGEEHAVGEASDVWSLGCTVIEMITGKMPFEWLEMTSFAAMRVLGLGGLPLEEMIASVKEEIQAIKQQEFPVEREGDFEERKLYDDTIDFILSCLQENPKKRPSAVELLQHRFLLAEVATVDGTARGADAKEKSLSQQGSDEAHSAGGAVPSRQSRGLVPSASDSGDGLHLRRRSDTTTTSGGGGGNGPGDGLNSSTLDSMGDAHYFQSGAGFNTGAGLVADQQSLVKEVSAFQQAQFLAGSLELNRSEAGGAGSPNGTGVFSPVGSPRLPRKHGGVKQFERDIEEVGGKNGEGGDREVSLDEVAFE